MLVLASDGLWDAVDNEEATQLALKWRAAGAEYAARALCMEAYARGSQDNITAVVSGAGGGTTRARQQIGQGQRGQEA